MRRAQPLLEPGESIRAAALVQLRVRPLYALLPMAAGAALTAPAVTSSDSLIPTSIALGVGLPLFAFGAILNGLTGPALLAITEGAAYVIRFSLRTPRLVSHAPLAAVRVDLDESSATVGGERLWPPVGRRRELEALAGLLPEAERSEPERGPGRRLHQPREVWLAAIAALAIAALTVAVVLLGAVTETDEEAVVNTITSFRADLSAGKSTACGRMTTRARSELVENASVGSLTARPPRDCAAAVKRAAASLPALRRPPIQGIDITGDRAEARVGPSFAYQRVSLLKNADHWRIDSSRGLWVVHDAPPDAPPDRREFAARVQGVCGNNGVRYVSLGLRLARPATRQTNRTTAKLLRAVSSLDRDVARRLSALTPPPGDVGHIARVSSALLAAADARDAIAGRVAQGTSTVDRPPPAFARAQRDLLTASRQSGLETALSAGCL
ncbi:MAG: hypothetical protein ACR2J6_06155 [Thermoleophilaceae bacterium]